MTNSAVRFSSRSLLANGSPVYRTDGKLGGLESARFRQTLHYSDVPSCFGTSILTGASLRFLFGSWTIVTACFCLMETGNPCAIWRILMTAPVIYVSKSMGYDIIQKYSYFDPANAIGRCQCALFRIPAIILSLLMTIVPPLAGCLFFSLSFLGNRRGLWL